MGKILSFEELRLLRADQPKEKIRLTIGCYDVPHPGHHEHFRYVKGLGGLVVVGAWSDEFCKRKGAHRPVFDIGQRLGMIADLELVSFAFPMPPHYQDRAKGVIAAIALLQPDTYVLGGEPVVPAGVYLIEGDRTVEVIDDPTYRDKSTSSTGIIQQLGAAGGDRALGVDVRHLPRLAFG